MLENIKIDLNPIIQQIADILGVSVDFIKNNFTEYLLQYSRYQMIKSIHFALISIFIFYIVVAIIFNLVLLDFKVKKEHTIKYNKVLALVFTIIIMLLVVKTFMLYLTNPYIYGLEKLQDYIQFVR